VPQGTRFFYFIIPAVSTASKALRMPDSKNRFSVIETKMAGFDAAFDHGPGYDEILQ
jgi:hypothetical protein